jgi:tetrahydromethanopterin S-methyltransferase subunit G
MNYELTIRLQNIEKRVDTIYCDLLLYSIEKKLDYIEKKVAKICNKKRKNINENKN